MKETFLATLTPMLTLFLCIAIGFISKKARILPDNTGKVLAKLETWIFYPALSFTTMANNCTVASLGNHGLNVILSSIGVAIAMCIAIPLSHIFVKEKTSERGIYAYALAFANSGYMGDPIVQAMFGDKMLSYYKLYCLPVSLVIYTWGISVLVPQGKSNKGFLKKILNAPTVAMLIGIVFGISGLGNYIPTFVGSTLNSLKACMGPVAMLIAGFTIASYDLKKMLTNVKVYVASLLRLFVLPAIIIAALFFVKEIFNLAFGLNVQNTVLFLALFAVGTPLGLNTVVFPEAYGGNPETGASMTTISHTLAVISIPIMYALMTLVFGSVVLP